MHGLLGRVFALLVFSLAVHADDFESLHITNINLDLNRRATLQVHTRLRTFENAGSYNQFRVGPILSVQVLPRTGVLFGYYLIDQNRREVHTRYRIHRIWSGVQVRAINRNRFWMDTRAVAERFVSTELVDYWRLRSRAMIWRPTPLGTAYLSGEALRQQRIWYGRYTAGLQWRLHQRLTLASGYEYRQSPAGGGSHIIATTLQWQGVVQTPQHVD